MLKIWDFGSTARSGQAKPAALEALISVPSHVIKEEHEAVYFWKEARMDSFAVVPMMS